jgi:hypothetical protein
MMVTNMNPRQGSNTISATNLVLSKGEPFYNQLRGRLDVPKLITFFGLVELTVPTPYCTEGIKIHLINIPKDGVSSTWDCQEERIINDIELWTHVPSHNVMDSHDSAGVMCQDT